MTSWKTRWVIWWDVLLYCWLSMENREKMEMSHQITHLFPPPHESKLFFQSFSNFAIIKTDDHNENTNKIKLEADLHMHYKKCCGRHESQVQKKRQNNNRQISLLVVCWIIIEWKRCRILSFYIMFPPSKNTIFCKKPHNQMKILYSYYTNQITRIML